MSILDRNPDDAGFPDQSPYEARKVLDNFIAVERASWNPKGIWIPVFRQLNEDQHSWSVWCGWNARIYSEKSRDDYTRLCRAIDNRFSHLIYYVKVTYK